MRIAIIGSGPAALCAAYFLAPHHTVDIYERGKAIGRKFLVAGQGGFNLTNRATGAELRVKYSPNGQLDAALDAFDSQAVRAWLGDLGVDTYEGSSGRIFPTRGTKPIEVLKRIEQRLLERGVRFHLEHAFIGFDAEERVLIGNNAGSFICPADIVIFALGGASWPVTGSTGDWTPHFEQLGIRTIPFAASNCGIHVPWPAQVHVPHAGKPLKNIRVTCGDRSVLGEATISDYGLEGNAIYPVVPAIREALRDQPSAVVVLDLKPSSSEEQLLAKLDNRGSPTTALNLAREQIAILKAFTTKEEFTSPAGLVRAIKKLTVPVTGLRPISEAISTVGGIAMDELDTNFALRKKPMFYAIGEMVDWDAPTGGFLIQGCLSMGHWVARAILSKA